MPSASVKGALSRCREASVRNTLRTMYAALGYTSDAVWAERVKAAERLAPEIYRIADALAMLHLE
jgi:hypothetical protein